MMQAIIDIRHEMGTLCNSSQNHWNAIHADGVPNDGIPIEEVVTVSEALTAVYVIFAVAGLVYAVVCLLFNLIYRKRV